jgi:hypothetical protein
MGQQGNGNGFEFQAGPASAKATGATTVNVLLAMLVIGAVFYSLYATNQQSLLIHQDHKHMNQALIDLTHANETLFLSTMLPNERKKDLRGYVQDRAREIVERRAQEITQDRQ